MSPSTSYQRAGSGEGHGALGDTLTSARNAPREAVEDRSEPELELLADVVTRLEDVLGRELDR